MMCFNLRICTSFLCMLCLMLVMPVSFAANNKALNKRQIAYYTQLCLKKRMSLESILSERTQIWNGEQEETWKQGQTFDEWHAERWKVEEKNCRKIAIEFLKQQN